MHIHATKNNPEIILDPVNRKFSFTGISIPENASEFYAPVVQWLRDTMDTVPDDSIFDFRLHYFNSSSLKAIYLVLMEVKKGVDAGKRLSVNWFVEEDDEFMTEAAETFSDLIGMPMNVVITTDK